MKELKVKCSYDPSDYIKMQSDGSNRAWIHGKHGDDFSQHLIDKEKAKQIRDWLTKFIEQNE